MEKPDQNLDFLRPDPEDPMPRPKPPAVFFGRALLAVGVFLTVAIGALSFGVVVSGESNSFPSLDLFSTIRQLVGADERTLQGEDRDRVNVLLLGIGGEGHEGPQLTDTIMLASWKPSSKEVGVLSIPRDMATDIPGYGVRKINNANAYGEVKERGSGPQLTAQVVEQTFGQPIDYYVRVDFAGFAQLIDDIGGIDVYVDRSFTDDRYPVLGKETTDCGSTQTTDPATGLVTETPNYDCRFVALSFTKGWTHMDGETALNYVRSRHGTNGEASDFARSRRQQKVIVAVKEKVFSAQTLLNPARLNEMRQTLQANINTNFETWELIRFANALKDFDASTIRSRVLDASETSPLYATSLNGAYVLLPKNDDWRPIRDMAEKIFDQPTTIAAPIAAPRLGKVEIQNGTAVSGLASRASLDAKADGFEVIGIGNATERGYAQTVIYDLTGNKKLDALKVLVDRFEGRRGTKEEGTALATQDGIDFLVILGQNSANLQPK